ncbi:pirin [Desulfovibrio sp. OttesenSCG-928-O18]|nr:pirin [Desulfovibrio sp. OttesenSCG-928-O18]
MPSKKPRITVYLSPEEHAAISASAARAGISLSKFAKLVCTGIPVPSLEHKQAVQDIIKARADLGRFGGLLKQAIAAGGDKITLQRLLREADAGMRELKAAAMKIR